MATAARWYYIPESGSPVDRTIGKEEKEKGLELEIETWRQEGVFRPLTEIEPGRVPGVVISKELLYSNNYVGLTTHPLEGG